MGKDAMLTVDRTAMSPPCGFAPLQLTPWDATSVAVKDMYGRSGWSSSSGRS